MRKTRLILILVSIILMTSSPLSAETVTWNAGAGLWNTSANWNPQQVPLPGDDVIINAPVSGIITINSDVNIKTLALRGAHRIVLSSHKLTINNALLSGSLDITGFNAPGIPSGMALPDVDSSDNHYGIAYSVAIQGDGKIVTAGYADHSGGWQFAVTRHNSDGTLDTTFNSTGIAKIQIGDHSIAQAVAVQPDQKIVMAGYSIDSSGNNRFALARYNTDGTLDTLGFNPLGAGGAAQGTVITAVPGGNGTFDRIAAVAMQRIGVTDYIMVAGSVNNGSKDMFTIARYNLNGTLDSGFATGGIFAQEIGVADSYAMALAIQPADQKIVAAGYSAPGGMYKYTVVRLTANGGLDTATFAGGTGIVTLAPIPNCLAHGKAVALQGDGSIVVAGDVDNGSNWDFAVARFTSTGIPDAAFNPGGGTPGALNTSPPGGYIDAWATSVVIQADQKIVIAGGATRGNIIYDFALVRYNTNGSLDTSFGAGGKVTTLIGTGTDNEANGLALQGDGKLVAAGFSSGSSGNYFAVARYWP